MAVERRQSDAIARWAKRVSVAYLLLLTMTTVYAVVIARQVGSNTERLGRALRQLHATDAAAAKAGRTAINTRKLSVATRRYLQAGSARLVPRV